MISFKRSERIAGMIRREIADILLKEISDPRIGDITVTDVILSGDLRQATVFLFRWAKTGTAATSMIICRRHRVFSRESWAGGCVFAMFPKYASFTTGLLSTGAGSIEFSRR